MWMGFFFALGKDKSFERFINISLLLLSREPCSDICMSHHGSVHTWQVCHIDGSHGNRCIRMLHEFHSFSDRQSNDWSYPKSTCNDMPCKLYSNGCNAPFLYDISCRIISYDIQSKVNLFLHDWKFYRFLHQDGKVRSGPLDGMFRMMSTMAWF